MYNPDPNAAAGGAYATYVRFAATLDGGCSGAGVAAFDAAGFRLTHAEASLMDPNTRLLLEHAAEAVADTGSAADMSTGVYLGCMWSQEYVELLPQLGVVEHAANVTTGRPGFKTSRCEDLMAYICCASSCAWLNVQETPSLSWWAALHTHLGTR